MEKIFYEANTGSIKGVCSGTVTNVDGMEPVSVPDDVRNHALTVLKKPVSAVTHYVDLTVNPPAIKTRPTNPVVVNKTTIKADGTDTAIFSNIPNGTVCTHDGETYTITDGMIEFTTTHDGDYDFVFELFPYITASFTITAEEPTQ